MTAGPEVAAIEPPMLPVADLQVALPALQGPPAPQDEPHIAYTEEAFAELPDGVLKLINARVAMELYRRERTEPNEWEVAPSVQVATGDDVNC